MPGMSLSQARAILPHFTVAPARPNADARALARLAAWSLRYSPLVAPCSPDGLWIDATGAAHLFGGEAAMVTKITKHLRGNGVTARVAMAGTPGAAWAWARYGGGDPILTAGMEHTALDPLPLHAMRLSQDTVRSLRYVGLKTIGDLRAIPRATVPMRFGADVLRRLDQAVGLVPEAIDPILPPTAKRRHMAFVEPIGTHEDLNRVIGVLVNPLCGDLEKTHEGARKLDLVFTRTDNTLQIIRIGTAQPSRNPKHIAKLLAEKLVTVDPGFGIEAAALTAWRVGPLSPAQIETSGSAAQAERDLGELIDRLSNRIGALNVFRIAPVASDIPERAAIPANPMIAIKGAWPRHLPRPVRLLSPPEPIAVFALVPDYPPATFRWRGETHKVRCADGPERIFGEWWTSPQEAGDIRDYFRVENERGERYWLFRAGDMTNDTYRWYLHGIFA